MERECKGIGKQAERLHVRSEVRWSVDKTAILEGCGTSQKLPMRRHSDLLGTNYEEARRWQFKELKQRGEERAPKYLKPTGRVLKTNT